MYLRVVFALIAATFTLAPAHAADPAWYKRKKEVQVQKQKEAEEKANEKPIEAGSTAELSQNTAAPLDTNFLFKSEGHTDAFGLDYGKLNQDVISGTILHVQYGMGWWWKPNLVFSGVGRLGGMLADTFMFMMVSLGPELRYFLTQHWMFAGSIALQYSQGFTRVPATHIPPPPSEAYINARYGISGGVSAAYMFWPNRTLGIGPIASAYYGTQSDRTFMIFSLGITFQSGRPNYTGDLTSGW